MRPVADQIYSVNARGTDLLSGAYDFIDRVSKGYQEASLPGTNAWARYHDAYED